jgi:hypothetical protein
MLNIYTREWKEEQNGYKNCLVAELTSFMRALPLSLNHLIKSPPFNTITSGVKFQRMNFGRTQTLKL